MESSIVRFSSFETRMAKMYVDNQASGARFVVYLRQFKGLEQKNPKLRAAGRATDLERVAPGAGGLFPGAAS
jgi:hypothetical protein